MWPLQNLDVNIFWNLACPQNDVFLLQFKVLAHHRIIILLLLIMSDTTDKESATGVLKGRKHKKSKQSHQVHLDPCPTPRIHNGNTEIRSLL